MGERVRPEGAMQDRKDQSNSTIAKRGDGCSALSPSLGRTAHSPSPRKICLAEQNDTGSTLKFFGVWVSAEYRMSCNTTERPAYYSIIVF